ncbi:MAG: hypothetical protein GY771_08960, partial [bacterium]|nr:hypothetical protein [bacterium]
GDHMKRILLLTFGISLLMTVNALAAKIDFTDPAFSSALGAPSFFTSMGGGITFTPGPNNPASPPTLWWDETDGLGVQFNYEDDEIEGSEYLELTFSTPFILDSIFIADLFNERGYTERGFYQLNNDPLVTFLAAVDQNLDDPGDNGELTLDIGGVTVNSIKFTAPGLLANGEDHEFALQGVAGAPVPIPSAILLLGSGLLGLAGIRKKFKL